MDDIFHFISQWNSQVKSREGLNTLFDPKLEIQMLREELSEIEKAFQDNDSVEVLDGLCDIITVAIGIMHKIGLVPEDMQKAMEAVITSNFSKFPFQKYENGKVKKGKDFIPPTIPLRKIMEEVVKRKKSAELKAKADAKMVCSIQNGDECESCQ